MRMLSRVVRQAFPGRNELATTGDRLEGAVLAAAVVVTLLAVPVAGAVGSEHHARQQVQVETEQRTRQRAEAVLAENAPPPVRVDDRGTVLETTSVRATWLAPDGQERHGVVQARHGALAGATVPIWVDQHGGLTGPPLSAAGAAITSIGVALLVWGGTTAAAALLHLLTRFAHTRLRLRRWEEQWRQVSPDWTAR